MSEENLVLFWRHLKTPRICGRNIWMCIEFTSNLYTIHTSFCLCFPDWQADTYGFQFLWRRLRGKYISISKWVPWYAHTLYAKLETVVCSPFRIDQFEENASYWTCHATFNKPTGINEIMYYTHTVWLDRSSYALKLDESIYSNT